MSGPIATIDASQPQARAMLIETARANITASILQLVGIKYESLAERVADRAMVRYIDLWSALRPPLEQHGLAEHDIALIAGISWGVALRLVVDTLAAVGCQSADSGPV
jgi:hypothetical protein